MKHSDTRFKRLQTNLMKTVDAALLESATGNRKLSVAEMKALHDIIRAERPSVFIIQNVVINQLAYLRDGFEGTQDEQKLITEFLHDFQAQAALDRLSRESDVKDGIALQEGVL